jgi:hypothetical protein
VGQNGTNPHLSDRASSSSAATASAPSSAAAGTPLRRHRNRLTPPAIAALVPSALSSPNPSDDAGLPPPCDDAGLPTVPFDDPGGLAAGTALDDVVGDSENRLSRDPTAAAAALFGRCSAAATLARRRSACDGVGSVAAAGLAPPSRLTVLASSDASDARGLGERYALSSSSSR